MSYFSRGRHRAPSNIKRTAAAGAVAAAISATPMAMGTASAESINWDAVIQCESGGDVDVDRLEIDGASTASGLFQFVDGTWRGYGGTEFAPRAKDATAAEQRIVAERAYAAEGLNPWASSSDCWGGKTGSAPKQATKQAPKAVPLNIPETPRRHEAPVSEARTQYIEPLGQYTPGGNGTYEVKPGDTLTFLARDNGTTVDELVASNTDIVEHRDWIYVGEKLNLD